MSKLYEKKFRLMKKDCKVCWKRVKGSKSLMVWLVLDGYRFKGMLNYVGKE